LWGRQFWRQPPFQAASSWQRVRERRAGEPSLRQPSPDRKGGDAFLIGPPTSYGLLPRNNPKIKTLLVRPRRHHHRALRHRSRRRHHGPRNIPPSPRPQALPSSLRPTQPPPRRRPLRRQSKPSLQTPATPSNPKTLPSRRPGSIPREPGSHRHRPEKTRHQNSKKTTGKPQPSEPGA